MSCGRRALRAEFQHLSCDRGPCRLDRWLVPHILGLVVGGQNDREPTIRIPRSF